MRKIRKRVFAVVLAAALLFTMPGMTSYAEEDAQMKDISESITGRADADSAEEAETDARETMEEESGGAPKEDTEYDNAEEVRAQLDDEFTFTVEPCPHTGLEYNPREGGGHSGTCATCGTEVTAECAYPAEFQTTPNGHVYTCTVCGGTKTEAHTIALTAAADKNTDTVTLSKGCKNCGYENELGKAIFTFPEAMYGKTDKAVTWRTDIPAEYIMFLQADDAGEWQIDAVLSIPLESLFGSTEMTAKDHNLSVRFIHDTTFNTSDTCVLTFTVAEAPLTEDMVTLDKTKVTYNGTAQQPGVTVRHGQTTLKEGKDYDVGYSRGGAASTDFTSAGTVTITITGKGNYKGEVVKTFAIEQAAPEIGTVTAETIQDTLDVSQAVLSRTNQTVAGTLTLTDRTLKYGTNTYTWKFTPDDTVNYAPVTGTVQITVKDTIAPAAEYRIGADEWKKFINTASLGLFCKDYKTVAIRGTDNTDMVTGSGIALTQYYISDKQITDTGSIEWSTYTKPVSLNAQGTYFIYVKVTDRAGNTAVLNSEGIVIYAESAVSPAAFDYIYKENRDCTLQLAMNGNTYKGLTDQQGNAISTDNYTIDGNGTIILKAAYLDTLDKGRYTYQVSVNPQGIETAQMTLACAFTVNVKAKELTVTGAAAADRAYDGSNAVEITAVTLNGVMANEDVAVDLSGVQGTLSSVNAGTYSSVTLPELTLTGADKDNYTLIQPAGAVAASVTVTRLNAEITVGTDTYNKIFGDAAFTMDVTDNNTEADVQYEVTKGTDVVSVSNGTVTIQNAGAAAIKVSLPASANYTAAADKYIDIAVEKKGGYTVAALNRSYYYLDGGAGSIDLAALLPEDCGNAAYGTPEASGAVTYSAAPAVSDGKLSYTLDRGEVDAGGTITVTVATRNYEDITITVNVKLTDEIPVSLKAGTEVTLKNHVLIYGEPLSKLVFNEAEFVGSDEKTVKGVLAWKEAAATPNAGTTSAVWIFTPAEDKYASLEGTAAITVNKAEPTVSAAPAVEGRIYNPSITLKGDDLSDVTVTGVDGKKLEGGWSWQGADIVPTVDNSGYVAVFTPADTTNYKTAVRTIAVTVTKAAPYILVPPAAAGITYGETLNDSSLSGGTVLYGDGEGQAGSGIGSAAAVAGTFTWKEPSAKPAAADSGVTEYTILFMPFDTANYHSVEAKVKLTVNKAQNAPNMPGGTMEVPNSLKKVGDVPLPEGWEWQESDKDTPLEAGKPVSAAAVYTGEDKGNYEKETVTVTITRASCDHEEGDVLYTGAGEKAPTCTEDGLGHRECVKCGFVMESGIAVKALGHTGGKATCSRRAVCTRCSQPYGDTDSSKHGRTEVRGFVEATCTTGGRTGDTYCMDCGAKTKTGSATPALGHDYTSRVTKEPTTESEGVRTYTCTRCGYSYTRPIAKLPGSGAAKSGSSQPGAAEPASIPGTGNTAGTEIGTEPGSSVAQDAGTDAGIPFIKGEDGKIGWDAIRAEEEQAEEGSVINVDMNGTTVVPGDIFDSIRGRDITVTFDMGNGIIWSVDGKSVAADKAGDIDFSVKTGVSAVPADIVNNVAGEGCSIQLSLAYEGEFGFTAVLSINLGKENAGYTASLYYYNESTGELEFICADEAEEDGTASLAFTHASDYVIAIAEDGEESGAATEPIQPEETDKEAENGTAETEKPQSGQPWIPWWFAALVILVIAVGTGVFFAARKKRDDE